MKCRLTIGVVSMQPGVRILLGQLGVPFEAVARWDSLAPADYSAILVNASLDSSQVRALDAYARGGGAVIDTGHFLPRMEPGKFHRDAEPVITRAAGEDVFRDIWLADLDRAILRHADARHLGGAVHLGEWGGGYIAYAPFDIGRLITSTESRRRQFYSPYSAFPNEIVALVSKGAIRKIIERALMWLHQQRGIPYLHRWHFPGRLPNIFGYRIDSDSGTRGQVLALYEAARRQQIGMSWFLHVEAHREYLDLFNTMEDQEIGVHCFRHRTFRTFEENDANITEAETLLRRHGIHAGGYAAPNGFWNAGLARAVEHHRFEYSSEFSLDYDNLPFHPWAGGAFAHALQVPVHPVCIGSFLRVKASDDAMKRYFRWIIRRNVEQYEPVILYHHPGHEKADVMEDSFIYANSIGLHSITMGRYAAWWRARGAVRYTALFSDGVITVRFGARSPDVQLALRGFNGGVGFIGEDGEWRVEDIETVQPPDFGNEQRVEMPEDFARARDFSPLLLRHAIEDFNSRARQ